MEENILNKKVSDITHVKTISENQTKSEPSKVLVFSSNEKRKKKKSLGKIIKKKIKLIYSSYLLTYKSLSIKKITIFWSAILLGIIFILFAINSISNKFMIEVPTYGGTWNEGIIGVPRYINPVLATSKADKDLTALIYSGLLKKDSSGNMVNDLASKIEESEDGLTFTITINDEAKFHDGTEITSDDIIFTLSKIQDKNINSPLAINFEGVSIEKIDKKTIIFHLKKPYFYFKEILNFGILPKHIWGNISIEEFSLSDFNINPIGSGPYKISKIIKNSNVAKEYHLYSFKKYVSGRAFIDKINISIYQDNNTLLYGLNNGEINATTYLSPDYFVDLKNKNVVSKTLPNLFSISFNPAKNNLFSGKNVRTGLATSIDKQAIIDKIFDGYARKTDFIFSVYESENNINSNESLSDQNDKNIVQTLENEINTSKNDIAKNLIGDSLKDKNPEINISTADIEDLKSVANEIAKYWTNLGFIVNVKVYSLADMADVIKNRNFEVLLFGSIIEHDTDLYAYWHSSQRNYPGLNITGYASNKLDDNLETLKNSLNKEERKEAIMNINKELYDENQIIPIYSNNLNYLIENEDQIETIKKFIPENLEDSSERFVKVSDWYIYKEKIWRFGYFKKLQEELSNLIH